MSTSTTAKRDTKSAIMDAAEIVMAEHGANGATIREIVAEAGANISAVHYHFNSREGLVEAILGRGGDYVSRRRLEMIAEFDRVGTTPTPMDVVSFLVDPMIELLERKGEAGRRFLRFIARLQFDRRSQPEGSGLHIQEERRYYPQIRQRLTRLAEQACPDVAEADLKQRITMAIDTLLQSLANAEFMSTEWESDERRDELHSYAANLKAFLAGGLAAPPTRQQNG